MANAERIEEIQKQMKAIEDRFGGFSNIPAGKHIYWDLRDELQQLRQK